MYKNQSIYPATGYNPVQPFITVVKIAVNTTYNHIKMGLKGHP